MDGDVIINIGAPHMTADAIENFRAVLPGEVLIGVYYRATGDIHLALVEPRNSPSGAVPNPGSRSRINGVYLDNYLPSRGGGHAQFGTLVGIPGIRQTGQGRAIAPTGVCGFAIAQVSQTQWRMASTLSGLNTQYKQGRELPANLLREIKEGLNAGIGAEVSQSWWPSCQIL